jgi:hypothetical protein
MIHCCGIQSDSEGDGRWWEALGSFGGSRARLEHRGSLRHQGRRLDLISECRQPLPLRDSQLLEGIAEFSRRFAAVARACSLLGAFEFQDRGKTKELLLRRLRCRVLHRAPDGWPIALVVGIELPLAASTGTSSV